MKMFSVALCLLAAASAWSAPYRNVVNVPFNTRSDGPQSALVIDVPAGTRSATDLRRLVLQKAVPVQREQVRLMAQQVRRWKQRGVLPKDAQIAIDTLVVLRENGRIITPPRTRYGNGTLSFTFEGWNSVQEAFLRRVIDTAVPIIEEVYGKPALSGTVKVVNADSERAVTVDDVDAPPVFRADAGWTIPTKLQPKPYGTSYLQAPVSFSSNAAAWLRVRWQPNLQPSDGSSIARYNVYVWLPKDDRTVQRTRVARYIVHHAGGESVVEVDQTQNTDDGRWIQLGSYLMERGNRNYVELVNYTRIAEEASQNRIVIADAVRFVETQPIGDRDAVSGGIYNASTNEILFPVFSSEKSVVINLVHVLIHAFHGPLIFDYDAWEEGFARAVTLVVAHRVAQLLGIPDPDSFFKTDPNYHALPVYDLLNQPALGNNVFIAPSLKQLPISLGWLGGMWLPRMAMAGSAWLKVYLEDRDFFKKFNTQYYAQYNPNEPIKLSGDIPRLKAIAASVLSNGGTVEGLPFDRWYERQYVLDTSVSFGRKLYAWTVPTRAKEGQDDPGIVIVLMYYQTTPDGDERPLNDVCYPIYWDFEQQNRLYLGVQYERIDITDGEGTVAPLFINIGGAQRVLIDLPLGGLNVRIPYASGYGGTTNPDNPDDRSKWNNLYGTVLGLNSGSVEVTSSLGISGTTSLAQGGFGFKLTAPAFEQPARYTITVKDSNGNTVAVRQVNLGYTDATVTVEAPDSAQTLTRSFSAGLRMISLPILPFATDNADALGVARNQLLLAHWRQDAQGENKYLLYPTAPPFRPGLGYWVKLRSNIIADIRGVTPRPDQNFTIATTFGWNQIGNPFTTPVEVADIEVQYLLNDPVPFATAVNRGWVGGTIWRYNPANNSYEPVSTLQPWEGYWLRVLVAEGVTLTFPAPATRARRALTRSHLPKPDWLVTLTASAGGSVGKVQVGQSRSASTGFDAAFDRESPPTFEQMLGFSIQNIDWGAYAGRYAVDVRAEGTKTVWNLQIRTPAPEMDVTLTWSDLRSVPKRTRLVLEDEVSGRRYNLRTVSSITLRTDAASTRHLQLIAEPQAEGSLRIVGLRAQRTRGGTIAVSFSLSADAQVMAEILNASGKLVRMLQNGAPTRAGMQSLVWDGRDGGGVAVPAGAYLLRVRAQTEDGTSAQAILPMVVTR